MRRIQSIIAIFCTWLIVSPATWAQQAGTGEGHTWINFGPVTKWYQGPVVPPVNVSNSGRLESLVRAGKLYLSLQDAIAAALENNIDVEVQRYTPRLAETDLARAKAGGFIRGFSTSVSNGSASATGTGLASTTVSSVADSTSVQNLGPAPLNLDPALTGSTQWGHFTTPQTSTILSGTNTLVNRQQIYNFGVQEQFLSGTSASLGLYNTTQNTTSLRNIYNPVTSSYMDLTLTQHLLQGFGFAVNNRYIRIAKNNLQVADLVFKQQVINTVANVSNLYWDLAFYNEDVAVKRQALELAQKLYGDNKKQVEIGTLAPIEIVRAEAEVAAREQDLTISETNVLQQETILKNAISRNGVASPTIAEVSHHPHRPARAAGRLNPSSRFRTWWRRRLQNRPELGQTQLFLQNAKISLKGPRLPCCPPSMRFVDLQEPRAGGSHQSSLRHQSVECPPADHTGGSVLPRRVRNRSGPVARAQLPGLQRRLQPEHSLAESRRPGRLHDRPTESAAKRTPLPAPD